MAAQVGQADRFGVQDRPAGLYGAGIGWHSKAGWAGSAGQAGRFGVQDRPVGWSAGLYSAGIGAGSAGDRPAELAAQVRFGAQDRPAGLAAQVTRLAVQAEALLVNLQVRGQLQGARGS